MFFASAIYTSKEYGVTKVVIYSEKEDEERLANHGDSSLEGAFLHYENGVIAPPIADAILKAAAQDTFPVHFVCEGILYQLLKYKALKIERYYNPYRKNHIERVERIRRGKEIYVYSERCRCVACHARFGRDSIKNLCGIVPLRDNPRKTVKVDIQFCAYCGKYFLDARSLHIYEQRYGRLNISRHYITGNETYEEPREREFSPNSVLSRRGYSSTLPGYQRQRIILGILTTGEAGKAEIKDLLNQFVRINGKRHPHCIPNWEEDLKFVNDYCLEEEQIVRFE